MIIDKLSSADRYGVLHGLFPDAFEFLRAPGVASIADGRYELDGDRLVAIISRKIGKPVQEALLESHRRMIDIHFLLSGIETIGWRPVADCATIRTPYQEENDSVLYADAPDLWTTVPPGSFVVFFPEDAHAANVSPGPLHKVILKVGVNST
jgi:YhcH/YjgK/YiaL family protein